MKKIIIFLCIVTLVIYIIFNSLIGKNFSYFVKNSFTTYEQRQVIKKYLFPYKLIGQLEKEIVHLDPLNEQLKIKKNNEDIIIYKDSILKNNKLLKRYQLSNGFKHKINHKTMTGSGYIDFHNNNLLVLSPLGILGYTDSIQNTASIKQIKNNIGDFIGRNQFLKNHRLTIKDLFVHKDKLFISYTEEVKKDCWNTGVISGDMSYEMITFEKLFSSDQCVHQINKIDTAFSGNQSGGRIVHFDNDHILLSVGEYRERWLAQDPKSINGKVLKININTSNYKIITKGHRNPQGLYFDREKNLVLQTEHGPHGGDEINLIDVSKINDNELLNFGWAIASDGIHYCSMDDYKGSEDCDIISKKYPLYKNHEQHGFIKPLHSFVPSVGISEITKIADSKYVVAAMGKVDQGGKSLYFFDLSENNKLINLEKVFVQERVRDIKFHENTLYLFLGDSASIGVINLFN